MNSSVLHLKKNLCILPTSLNHYVPSLLPCYHLGLILPSALFLNPSASLHLHSQDPGSGYHYHLNSSILFQNANVTLSNISGYLIILRPKSLWKRRPSMASCHDPFSHWLHIHEAQHLLSLWLGLFWSPSPTPTPPPTTSLLFTPRAVLTASGSLLWPTDHGMLLCYAPCFSLRSLTQFVRMCFLWDHYLINASLSHETLTSMSAKPKSSLPTFMSTTDVTVSGPS